MIFRADSKDYPPIVIELKWNKSADSAIEQIKDRRYVLNLKGVGSEILLVGINYSKDSKSKKHTCQIESFYWDS